MKNYNFVEVPQKVFNRNRNRLTNEIINKYNITDQKSNTLIKEYISEKLNILLMQEPNLILDTVTLDL